MRRSRLRSAVVATAAAVAVVATAPGAQAAPGDPAPGSPEYLARDAQNIAAACGRQTAPDGLLAPAATPTRPALSPCMAVPGWNSGNPYRAGLDGSRGQITPVTFTRRGG